MHATKDAGKPVDCVKCCSCEAHCPQKIKISDVMTEMAKLF
jgi:predicted aldo/keto reductase-like oxidoreductase